MIAGAECIQLKILGAPWVPYGRWTAVSKFRVPCGDGWRSRFPGSVWTGGGMETDGSRFQMQTDGDPEIPCQYGDGRRSRMPGSTMETGDDLEIPVLDGDGR